MKIGDMVRLSKRAQNQPQNRHIAWDSIGFVCREMDADRLFYVKWFRRISETIHYRYELRIAK